MILETDDEVNAFRYVCNLASIATDRICNDLTDEECTRFKNCKVQREPNLFESVKYDFDIVEWIQLDVKIIEVIGK